MNSLGAYVAATALVLGALGGWTVRDWKSDSDEGKRLQAQAAALEAAQTRVDVAADKYEKERQRADEALAGRVNTVREYYKTTPVSADCAVPAPMHGLLAQAVAASNARASGEPESAVSAAPATGER